MVAQTSTLSPDEGKLYPLKVIIGEADWWSALSWKKSEWLRIPNLDSIFVPIERDKDWMTQLAELNDQLKAWMQETKPSQPSGFFPFLFLSKNTLSYYIFEPLLS